MPTSYHLFGRAIDVQRRRGVTHQMVDAALRRAGYALVESLDEGDHSHFAFAIATPSVAVTTGTTGTTSLPAGTAYKPLLPNLLADDHGVLIAAGTPVSDSGNLQVEPARLPSVRR